MDNHIGDVWKMMTIQQKMLSALYYVTLFSVIAFLFLGIAGVNLLSLTVQVFSVELPSFLQNVYDTIIELIWLI
jgi:hypothetical protein